MQIYSGKILREIMGIMPKFEDELNGLIKQLAQKK